MCRSIYQKIGHVLLWNIELAATALRLKSIMEVPLESQMNEMLA